MEIRKCNGDFGATVSAICNNNADSYMTNQVYWVKKSSTEFFPCSFQ